MDRATLGPAPASPLDPDSGIAALVEAATRNDALWCDRLTHAHRRESSFIRGLWTATSGAPPLIPDAVIVPGALQDPRPALRMLGRNRTGALSVLDGGGMADLGPLGFQPLFEGQWIVAVPGRARKLPRVELMPVTRPMELIRWESNWRRGIGLSEALPQFPPDLLHDRDVRMLYHRADSGEVVAGGLLFHAAGVVSVSNLHAVGVERLPVLAALCTAAAALWPGTPIVGCTPKDRLSLARQAGFSLLGPFRVWQRPADPAGAVLSALIGGV